MTADDLLREARWLLAAARNEGKTWDEMSLMLWRLRVDQWMRHDAQRRSMATKEEAKQ